MRSLRELCFLVLGRHTPPREAWGKIPRDLHYELDMFVRGATTASLASDRIDIVGITFGCNGPYDVAFDHGDGITGQYAGKVLMRAEPTTYAFTHSHALSELSRMIDDYTLPYLRDVDVAIIYLMYLSDVYDRTEYLIAYRISDILNIVVMRSPVLCLSNIDNTTTDLRKGSYVIIHMNCHPCMQVYSIGSARIVGDICIYVARMCSYHRKDFDCIDTINAVLSQYW